MNKRALLFIAGVLATVTVGIAALMYVRGRSAETRTAPNGDPATQESVPQAAAADHVTTTEPTSPERGGVTLDLRRQQLIGVRTTTVRRVTLAPQIRAVGVVRFAETRQAEVSTKIDGWIRELRANYTGKPIQRGEPLFTLYSPELITAQHEYLLAVRGQSHAARGTLPEVRDYAERLVQAARDRLLRWDLTADDIQELEKSGRPQETVTFRSPVAGVVVEKAAVEGMRVTAGQMLFRVADLSTVWLEADVYEPDLPLVQSGQSASVSLEAFPGEKIAGRVTYVYPSVDEKTRTGRVRFEFPNRGGRLKPGMYATVELAAAGRSALVVPADALLDTGKEQIVFMAQGGGYFEPRTVIAGQRSGGDVEIVQGVKEGEQVATGANFLLDSESQVRAAIQSYQATASPETAPAERQQVEIAFRAQPDPPRTGENMLEVSVKDAAGQPIADAEVTVTFFMAAMPSMNMPAMRNEARLPASGGGIYRGPGQIVMGGRWDVTVDVTRNGQRLGSRQFAVVAR